MSEKPVQKTMSFKIPSGMPGMLQYLAIAAGKPPEDPHQPITVGQPGFYKVVLTLSRPGYPIHPEAELTGYENLQGDSHLAIAKPAYSIGPDDDIKEVKLMVQTEDGPFELIGTPNKKGFLAQITADPIYATDHQNARTKVIRALSSALSNISIQLDMPLQVYQADVINLKTHDRILSIISPHRENAMSVAPSGALSKEFRASASLYREALNSNTPVFQFLCYFKIIEAIQERRERLIRELKAAGGTPSVPVNIVPSDPAEFVSWLSAIYHVGRDWDFITLESIFVPEARGKKINRIVEDYLRPIRVRIAHAVLDSGELALSADEEMDVREVYKWLPLTKCIVRHLLKSDFPSEFLPYIKSDGTVTE